MITDDGFEALVREIMEQGFDEQTAVRYAALLSDRPVYDEAGNIVVMEGSEVIATLKPLKFYEGEEG